MKRIVAFTVGLVIGVGADAMAQNGPGAPPAQTPNKEQQRARLADASGALLRLQTETSAMLELALRAGDPLGLDQGLERVRLELEWTEEQHARLRESLGTSMEPGIRDRLREMDATRARLLAQLQGMECELCDAALERLRLELQLSEEQHLRLCEGAGGDVDPATLERLREAHALRAQTRLQLREMECALCPAGDAARLTERIQEMARLQERLAQQYRELGQQLGLGATDASGSAS